MDEPRATPGAEPFVRSFLDRINRGWSVLDSWTEETGDAVILHVQGEVDLATAPAFRTELMQATDRGSAVIVDLSGAEYFDGSGLQVLASAYHLCLERGQRLVVASPSYIARLVIETVGLEVPMGASLDAARALVRQDR